LKGEEVMIEMIKMFEEGISPTKRFLIRMGTDPEFETFKDNQFYPAYQTLQGIVYRSQTDRNYLILIQK
jgi:hypothetical protein